MLPRLAQLDSKIPITLINGQKSWIKYVSEGKCLGEEISRLRPNSYVDLHTVESAGHHVHAEQPDVFCDLVNKACQAADCGADCKPKRVPPSTRDTAIKVEETDTQEEP